MWSPATDGQARPPARLVGSTARFLGILVRPGDEVDFRVDRVGIDQGAAEVFEVAARIGSDLVMSATARLLPRPRRSMRFPGAGRSARGHGHGRPARSKAARKVWDYADKFTARTLGSRCCTWSATTRPASSPAACTTTTPRACYLTQFTQVAMATVAAAAQVAEMRSAGRLRRRRRRLRHSVGEYTRWPA